MAVGALGNQMANYMGLKGSNGVSSSRCNRFPIRPSIHPSIPASYNPSILPPMRPSHPSIPASSIHQLMLAQFPHQLMLAQFLLCLTRKWT